MANLVISIVMNAVPLVDHSVVKVWILTLLYKSIPTFGKIFFSGLYTTIFCNND